MDDVIRWDEMYGPDGMRGADPQVVEMLDKEQVVVPGFAMDRYWSALMKADARWNHEHAEVVDDPSEEETSS